MTRVSVIDRERLRRFDIPAPKLGADKDARGVAGIIGGGVLAPGSVALAATAALRTGAGKVIAGIPRRPADVLGIIVPELGIVGFSTTSSGDPSARHMAAMQAIGGRADALAVGPGLSDRKNARALTEHLLRAFPSPLVVDACAIAELRALAPLVRRHGARVVITPHAGEMASLLGRSRKSVEADPERAARDAERLLRCTVVMKGRETYVITPEQKAYVHRGGVQGLATAGSGDVLAGILAGLLARGASVTAACLWSVFLHARAGRTLSASVGPLGFLAHELSGCLPALMARYHLSLR